MEKRVIEADMKVTRCDVL